jgi:cytochrome o ubiquinol oxidase subunit 2
MKRRLIFFGVPVVTILSLTIYLFQADNVAVLNPQGIIAEQQRNLIVFTFLLSMVVILPVFILLFVISWKYREGNPKKVKYIPDWAGNKWLETVWWGIPCIIILILSVVTWQTSHSLDPYKTLDSSVKPIKVQVVSLQWKWLFLYPDLGVASVNLLEFPEKTPIDFTITADSPMNSFWIPNLGGQVYAMSGMSTQLHLMASSTGDYRGSSANISGEGFAKMNFTARSVSSSDFNAWLKRAKAYPAETLSMNIYTMLTEPNIPDASIQYVLSDATLYDKILMKYMTPIQHDAGMDHDMHSMTEMEHMNE